jgi:hypothetical protein
MVRDDRQQLPHERPAQFERHLIQAFLAGAGHDAQTLLSRSDDEAQRLVAHASRYASERVSEIHVRWRAPWPSQPAPTHLYE